MHFRSIKYSFLIASLFSYPYTQAEPAKNSIVCPEMQQLGESLIAGDASGFYFADGLGGEFPVPSFFKVTRPASSNYDFSASILIQPENLPPSAVGSAEKIRIEKNVCDWFLELSIGPKKNFDSSTGGEVQLNKQASSSRTIGSMSVWLLDMPHLEGRSAIVASNEEGFVTFAGKSPEAAIWLLELFNRLQDNENN